MSTMGDERVAKVSAYIESGNKSSAMRFERTVYARTVNGPTNGTVINILARNQCSRDTSLVLYSMSFGAYQIMGFNLYGKDLNYQNTIAEFLNNPSDQLSIYFKFLDWKDINYTLDELKNEPVKMDTFALKYNGSTAYAAKVAKAITDLGM